MRVLLGGGDGHGFRGSFLGGDAKGAAIYGKLDAGYIGGETVVTQNSVAVGDFSLIFTAGPFHLDFLSLAGTLGKKAGQLAVLFYIGFDGIIVAVDAVIQGMLGGHRIQDGIVAAGIDLAEVAVTLTHDGLPDQQLGCYRIGQGVAAGVLGTPAERNRAGVAILQDTTDEGLDLIAGDGGIQFFGEVVPEVFIPAGEYLAGVLRNAGFDAIADITIIGVHCPDVGVAALGCDPAVHVVQFRVAPAIEVRFAVTGKADHVDLSFLTGGMGGERAAAQKCHEAHHHGHNHGGAPFENTLFHC